LPRFFTIRPFSSRFPISEVHFAVKFPSCCRPDASFAFTTGHVLFVLVQHGFPRGGLFSKTVYALQKQASSPTPVNPFRNREAVLPFSLPSSDAPFFLPEQRCMVATTLLHARPYSSFLEYGFLIWFSARLLSRSGLGPGPPRSAPFRQIGYSSPPDPDSLQSSVLSVDLASPPTPLTSFPSVFFVSPTPPAWITRMFTRMKFFPLTLILDNIIVPLPQCGGFDSCPTRCHLPFCKDFSMNRCHSPPLPLFSAGFFPFSQKITWRVPPSFPSAFLFDSIRPRSP